MNNANKFTDGKRRVFLSTLITELYIGCIAAVAGFLAGWYVLLKKYPKLHGVLRKYISKIAGTERAE